MQISDGASQMKIVIESSIQELVSKALRRVSENWRVDEWENAVTNPVSIENVLNEPHRLVDFEDEDGKRWAIIMPAEPGKVFIMDYHKHIDEISSYAGGTISGPDSQSNTDDMISIIVTGDEKIGLLELRIVHELLHGLNLPADDLAENADSAFKPHIRFLYNILKFFGLRPEHTSFFQRRYYRWLLESR